ANYYVPLSYDMHIDFNHKMVQEVVDINLRICAANVMVPLNDIAAVTNVNSIVGM
ncbi:hypothetical protein KI387_019838, partial [Taxus chinensis]